MTYYYKEKDMIVLSNCLTKTPDEGGLKLATSLVKRIKQKNEDTFVISFDRQSEFADIHLPINKFLLNRKLISIVKKRKQRWQNYTKN